MDICKFINKNLKQLKINPASPDLEHIHELLNEIDPDLEIEFEVSSDPEISPINSKKKKKGFKKRSILVIRILYSCLFLNIPIFVDSIIVNNRTLINLLAKAKRLQLRTVSDFISDGCSKLQPLKRIRYPQYQEIFNSCLSKVTVIDKIISIIEKLCEQEIMKESDTFLMLTIPYYFVEHKYIEQYG